MGDPRILYDAQSQRWVAAAIDEDSAGGSGNVILAVSTTDNPTNVTSGWTKYMIPVQRGGLLTDFTTLGLAGC